MNRALFTGLSGTITHQQRLDVIANNLVNANTVGYKQARTTFKDAFYQTLQASSAGTSGGVGGMNAVQVGSGVSLGSSQALFTQGALEQTGQPLDAAIDGKGMFVISAGVQQFFTRDGAFTLDSNNILVAATTGHKVQGWLATGGQVNTTGAVGDMSFPLGQLRAPQSSGEVTVVGNLDATTTAAAPALEISVYIYDSLGISHDMVVSFTKTANVNEWDCEVTAEGQSATATITFDASGAITGTSTVTLSMALTSGATTPQDIDVDLSNMTQLAQTSTPVVRSQDGYGPAALVEVGVSSNGIIQGRYSDGRTDIMGQIAVANFVNLEGLERTGQNLFVSSANSGTPEIGAAGTGGRGAVVSRALELSKVDLTRAFVDMINTQRGFQASSQVISAGDKILELLMQINR